MVGHLCWEDHVNGICSACPFGYQHEKNVLPTGEEAGHEGDVLVKGDGGVEGDKALQERFPDVRDYVAAHGQQDGREGEHHGRRRSSGYRHSITCYLAQSCMLRLVCIIYEENAITVVILIKCDTSLVFST